VASVPALLAASATGVAPEHSVFEVRSSVARAGRPFLPDAELELLPALSAAARRLPRSPDSVLLVVAECPLPLGIPDVLAVVADRTRLAARFTSDISPLLAQQDARVAAACGIRRPTSLASLSSVTGVSDRHTRTIVKRLERAGAITRFGSGWLRDPVLVPVGRTYALEAKVSDWRRGLAQCLRYSTLADATALAIGVLPSRAREEALRAAADVNVGVFFNGRWIVRPRISRLAPDRRLWVNEHILSALGDHASATEP